MAWHRRPRPLLRMWTAPSISTSQVRGRLISCVWGSPRPSRSSWTKKVKRRGQSLRVRSECGWLMLRVRGSWHRRWERWVVGRAVMMRKRAKRVDKEVYWLTTVIHRRSNRGRLMVKWSQIHWKIVTRCKRDTASITWDRTWSTKCSMSRGAHLVSSLRLQSSIETLTFLTMK